VIGSAIVPTLIANAFYLPRHLIPPEEPLPDAQKPEAAPQVAAAVAGRS